MLAGKNEGRPCLRWAALLQSAGILALGRLREVLARHGRNRSAMLYSIEGGGIVRTDADTAIWRVRKPYGIRPALRYT